jgi:predicted HicB family RNase H-like nuclease
MSKRENSSLILQNLKKRELRPLGEPVVPMSEAERRITRLDSDVSEAIMADSYHDSRPASSIAVDQPSSVRATKLRPRERVARSALIIRLNPALHRELEEVARFNRLTMNDIAIEAIELHLRNFPHPGDGSS